MGKWLERLESLERETNPSSGVAPSARQKKRIHLRSQPTEPAKGGRAWAKEREYLPKYEPTEPTKAPLEGSVGSFPGGCAFRNSSGDWSVQAAWLNGLSSSDLPPVPFELRPSVTVVDAEKFLDALRADMARGAAGPRARTGAIQADCRDLKKLVESHSHPEFNDASTCPQGADSEETAHGPTSETAQARTNTP